MKTLIFTMWLIWDIVILAVQWIKWQAKIYFTCQKILDWQAIFFLYFEPWMKYLLFWLVTFSELSSTLTQLLLSFGRGITIYILSVL